MNRTITQSLVKWRDSKYRKPLLLKGARQIGKTFALRAFGEKHFAKCHYLNFEEQLSLHKIFAGDLDPKIILRDIQFTLQQSVSIGQDLLVLDEIQTCPAALTSLKYFAEKIPNLHIAAAGSHLGLHLSEGSFPVGKVDSITMYPLSFYEFLDACQSSHTIEAITAMREGAHYTEAMHSLVWGYFLRYLIVGGLPEVVSRYLELADNEYLAFGAARQLQSELITNYLADIAKHSGKVNAMHIERIWRSVPAQFGTDLLDSATRFRFSGIIPKISQYSRLANAIDWLTTCGLALRIPIIDNASTPLLAAERSGCFKLFMFDVGLLGAMAQIAPSQILAADYGTFKGYLAENFVAQSLTYCGHAPIYNWRRNTSEVDFLITNTTTGEALPIEVKSGKVTHSPSLNTFHQQYKPKMSLMLSGRGVVFKNGLPNHWPIYGVEDAVTNYPNRNL